MDKKANGSQVKSSLVMNVVQWFSMRRQPWLIYASDDFAKFCEEKVLFSFALLRLIYLLCVWSISTHKHTQFCGNQINLML